MNIRELFQFSNKQSMFHIFILFEVVTSKSLANYHIIFDKEFSPPQHIPAVHNMYYSVPLNQEISKPIIAYVVDLAGRQIRDGSLAQTVFNISTMNVNTAANENITDEWKKSGGTLCQTAVVGEMYPERMDRSRAITRCGTHPDKTVLHVHSYNGKIVIDGIFHHHSSVPQNPRIIRIVCSSLKLTADTYPFLITKPADHLVLDKLPPSTVIANHPFQLTAKITDRNGSRLTRGLDSIAYVELVIPTPHTVIRKRASEGFVYFNNIRIQYTKSNLSLNLRMIMARYPWNRIPNCPVCYDDVKNITLMKNKTKIKLPTSDKNKPILLTRPMNILSQTASYLKVANHTLQEWKKWFDPKINAIRIARNIPIPGRFTVYLLDKDAERIYSGPDAFVTLSYSTIPPGVCISQDATEQLSGGWAHLFVSICQLVTNVKLVVSIENKNDITVATPDFRVEGIIHIAHLGHFKNKDDSLRVESGIDNFVSIAAFEINQGIIVSELARSGIKLKLTSLDTGSKVNNAIEVLYNLTDLRFSPATQLQGIISSANEHITFAINPKLTASHIPYISLVNTGNHFSDKSEFPYINRICWSDMFILESVIYFLKRRNWMMVLILREIGLGLGLNLRRKIKDNNIHIEKELVFSEPGLLNNDTHYFFPYEMDQIDDVRSRIILLVASGRMQTYILHDAYLKHFDMEHGYQWIIYGPYVWEFPFQNQGPCSDIPKKCTATFRGTLFIGETYNVIVNHHRWMRVLDQNFAIDKYDRQKGITEYRSLVITARQVLGYDALLLLAHSINKVVSEGVSLTGTMVNKYIRQAHLNGMSGRIVMNDYGDRMGYKGFLAQVCPIQNDFYFLRLLDLVDSILIETPFESVHSNGTSGAEVELPTSTQYNIIRYYSYSGLVSLRTQDLISIPKEPWPSVRISRTEKVLPAFTCNRSCGFTQTNKSDVNIYDSGRCIGNGECYCKPGYYGKNCKKISCNNCIHGKCTKPNVCDCRDGWNGSGCNIAQCKLCVMGICDSPGKCTCFLHAVGKHCSVHVAFVIIPVIAGAILLFIGFLGVKAFLKHRRQKFALGNTDWLIDPLSVEWCPPETVSRASIPKRSRTLLAARCIETYLLKNEKWYAKRVLNVSIDIDDIDLRLEMSELLNIKHPNLIRFGGACVIHPNVCLFIEVATRGSLNNVLHLASLNLSTDFRFSFMKDICSGMRYLHEETQVGSHGRLHSHNCLIFSYWVIKIAGFGANIIRYGKYRQETEKTPAHLKKLLWTAPELLNGATCLDDVKNGTKSGDVYSFAIVVTEILTRCDPFEYELEYINEKDMLDFIKDPFNSENAKTRIIWRQIGGLNTMAIRPILYDADLTQTVLHRKMVRRLLAESWDRIPESRPSFKKIYLMLQECHSARGNLMDNLINLISSYSSNLEMIVLERTQEIKESNEKSEHLLRQLLPSNIAEELKKGKKIVPELFECVTVFFSDIVNMREVVIESTPIQIVDFLNDMHNAFQSTIERYNVYKVDMICDTYIIVSGLPERIGKRHAGEIATMSLHLLSLVTKFKIRHRPKDTLQIRMGIHSGPVVSGIVGTMMPKYCVFGDTVNTASRMQSSSIAHRIQVSDATAEILNEIGGYQLDARGSREVKGRGSMFTYWLTGKDGFNYRLPDGSLALSLSKHRFK